MTTLEMEIKLMEYFDFRRNLRTQRRKFSVYGK